MNMNEDNVNTDLSNDELEMQQLFGVSNAATGVPDTTDSNATDETQVTSASTEGNTSSDQADDAASENNATQNNDQPVSAHVQSESDPEDRFTSKSNSAFAQMRIQNRELSDLIMNLAKASGQNPSDLAEAQNILKEGLTKVISRNKNIPEEVLREMEADKKALAEVRQEQARQKALAGFQQVKDLHGLSREELNNFADKLIEQHLNPFEQPNIDLVKEYRNMYFEKLLADAKEQGIQEERARSIKASQSSTTPSTRKGLSEDTGTQNNPIKSVEDLNKLFDSLK